MKEVIKGRPRNYDDREELLKNVNEYFVWAKKNPLVREELLKTGSRAGKIVKVKIPRPLMVIDLAHFLGISRSTFYEYLVYPEFADILTIAKEKIYNQKLMGAMVGTYNAYIVAAELGLLHKEVKPAGELNQGSVSIYIPDDGRNKKSQSKTIVLNKPKTSRKRRKKSSIK